MMQTGSNRRRGQGGVLRLLVVIMLVGLAVAMVLNFTSQKTQETGDEAETQNQGFFAQLAGFLGFAGTSPADGGDGATDGDDGTDGTDGNDGTDGTDGGEATCTDPSMTWDPLFASAGMEVEFTALTEGCDSYSWEFGDGDTGSGETTTHTYDSSGDYTVTLEVEGPDGTVSTQSTVTVEDNLKPRVTDVTFEEADSNADGDGTIDPGETMWVTATASDPEAEAGMEGAGIDASTWTWTTESSLDYSGCDGTNSCTVDIPSDAPEGLTSVTVTVEDTEGAESNPYQAGFYLGYSCSAACVDSEVANNLCGNVLEGSCPTDDEGNEKVCCEPR